jgi:hypothetical protein
MPSAIQPDAASRDASDKNKRWNFADFGQRIAPAIVGKNVAISASLGPF